MASDQTAREAPREDEPQPVDDGSLPASGVWLCYYSDGSAHAVFPTEIEALRHAVRTSMQVKFQEWGEV